MMITTSIKLDGEVPAKKNSRINTKDGRSFPSKRYSAWHKSAQVQIFEQIKPMRINRPCELSICFIHGDLRRRDSDNGVSSICDLLVDTGVIEDDNWQIVCSIKVRNEYQKGNAHCLVNICYFSEEGEK